VFTFLNGNLQRPASHCKVPEEALSGSLVYASTRDHVVEALRHEPAILILSSQLAGSYGDLPNSDTCCFSVRNISMGMAVLLKYFDQKSLRFTQWGQRHPTAVVHADAQIGDGVFLGPYCVVGAHAVIGDRCMIGAHAVIENHAHLGAGCVIHPHVFVGSACEIGRDCEIHPHTSIGSDGFGYAVEANGTPRKISHLGNVRIGDGVEIGSNCAIDRATLTSTHVRSGTKIDNICHVAHNCDLGENGFYTAGFMMGGSTKIGRQFVTGGCSVVTSHVTLADNVVLAGRSTVTNDVPDPGSYGGYPLQPLKEAMKTAVSIGHLNEIRRNLKRVMKHLHLSEATAKTAVDL
jgi:UDP-3-O-[3-hydroxymyristoyl] glucosamine N-acyltransferase